MAFKYRIEGNNLYFLTTTVIDWIDVFTRKELAHVVIDSLQYCQKEKGLEVYAWCLMPSHLHLVASANPPADLSAIMRDFKKFTSKKILAVIEEINESRRDWLVDKFAYSGRVSSKNRLYKFWQDGVHPIELAANFFIDQKVTYIHNNPVEAGLVFEPHHYAYSSAVDYAGGKGLLDVVCVG